MARRIVPGATDTQCGFKFFSGPLARAAALPLRTTGFAFDVELIAICQRLGATLTEIPVRWRDVPGSTFSVPRHSAPRSARRRPSGSAARRPGGRAGRAQPGPPRHVLPAGMPTLPALPALPGEPATTASPGAAALRGGIQAVTTA